MGSNAVFALFAALALCACGSPFSSTGGGEGGAGAGGDGPASSSSGAGNSGAGGGEGECHDDTVCVPEGWNAVAAYGSPEANTVPLCPAELPVQLTLAMADLEPPTIECQCSCGNTNVSCTGGQAFYGSGCDSIIGTVSDVCTTANIGAIDFETPPVPSGSCPNTSGEPTIPPLQWNSNYRLCASSAAPATCSGGTCAPTQDKGGQPLCVARAGDQTCPTSFSNKVVAYTGVSDQRSCSPCSCQPSCEDSYVQLYSATNCDAAAGTVGIGACQTVTPQSAKLVRVGGCVPDGGQPNINVEPQEPITICCAVTG